MAKKDEENKKDTEKNLKKLKEWYTAELESDETQFLLKYADNKDDHSWGSEFEEEPRQSDGGFQQNQQGGRGFNNRRDRGNRGRRNFNYFGNRRGRRQTYRGNADTRGQSSWDDWGDQYEHYAGPLPKNN